MSSLTTNQQTAIDQIIASNSSQYGVDQNLIRAFIQQESNWDINARLWEPTLNEASIGLMQVLVTTAASILGRAVTEQELYDPNLNIAVGTHYINTLQTQYGSQGINAVISAYNAGHPISSNTDYVDKVLTYYKMFVDLGATAGQYAADTLQKMTGGPSTGSASSPLGMMLISAAVLLFDVFKFFHKGKAS